MTFVDLDTQSESACGQPILSDDLFQLGLRYSTGRDVPSDFIVAHKWFNLAAMLGNEAARACRQELSREMSRGEIVEAQRQARTWLLQH
jgi:uncharacterized protein